MTSSRDARRAKRHAQREWEKHAKRTFKQQKAEAANDDVAARLERDRRRTWVGYGLLAAAVVVAGSHILEHLGAIHVLGSVRTDDIFIGYPTALTLALVGLILLPAVSSRGR